MSETSWKCQGCGYVMTFDRIVPSPTVPASDHQRALSERDEARAQAAVMRRALEAWREWLAHCPPDMVTQGIASDLEAALSSSSAGRALLEEMEGLRKERDEARAQVDALSAKVRWHRDREAHFASVLGIADGGQYRNDWDARLQRLIDAAAESADLRARLERAEARRFPIMGGPSIPWAMIAPHARQAKSNHDQSLERLAERGGLSPLEAVAVLESKRWREVRHLSESEGLARLTALLAAWESAQSAAEVRRAVEKEPSDG